MSPDERSRLSPLVKVTAALLGLVVLLGLVAVSGFLGAKIAMEIGTTTTTSTTTTTIDGEVETPATLSQPINWWDLTDAEQVWCMRDRETFIDVLRATEVLYGGVQTRHFLAFYDYDTERFESGLEHDWTDFTPQTIIFLARIEMQVETAARWFGLSEPKDVDIQLQQIARACRAVFQGPSSNR